MIDDSEIIAAFRYLLGYKDVPQKMVVAHRGFKSPSHLRQHIMNLPRFRDEVAKQRVWADMASIQLDRQVIVFQHVPKCGGSSLHKVLEANFGKAFLERHNGLANWAVGDLAQGTLFSGHYDTPSLALIPATGLKVVTVLRDPKSRLMSLYRYLRSISPKAAEVQGRNMKLVEMARRLSAEDFFEHPTLVSHPSINNAITRQFSGPVGQKYWESVLPRRVAPSLVETDPKRALACASKHLESMVAIGLLEAQDETFPFLFESLGLPKDTIFPHANTLKENLQTGKWFEPVAHVPLTYELDMALAPHIELDQKLYYAAVKILYQRGILPDAEIYKV